MSSFKLRTLDPADVDVSDLDGVRDIVADSRVVAIGESAHGVLEFYQLRDRLFRFLVDELGFTALVLESGFPESLAVNDWVLGGDGDVEELARTNVAYGLGGYTEVHEMLRWMRAWNAGHDRSISLYGMDLAGSAGFPAPAIAETLARVAAEPGDDELLRLAGFGHPEEGQIYAHQRYAAMPAEERERLSKGVSNLVARARASGDDIALRCAVSAGRLDELLRHQLETGTPGGPGYNPRDESMTDTIHWILEREERILIAAHNQHVQRVSYPIRSETGAVVGEVPVVGSCLSPALGDDLVVIGTTYRHGQVPRPVGGDGPAALVVEPAELPDPPPGSIDEFMDRRGDRQGLDLRALRRDGPPSTLRLQLCGHDLIEFDVTRAYDAVIHIRDVHPIDGYEELQRRRWQRPHPDLDDSGRSDEPVRQV